MKTEREFNIFGPINPAIHYHVDRIATKAELREKIAKGRYLILDMSPQTGKTTIFYEMIAELEATGEYFGILLDFKQLANDDKSIFYRELAFTLDEWRKVYAPDAPEPQPMRHHGDFGRWLRQTGQQSGKECVLIIDEFESASPEIITSLLSFFRGMYVQRYQPGAYAIHSLLLVGVRTVSALLGGAQSPFNIADQFTVPYLTADETKELLIQHTEATGQVFDEDVFHSIYKHTEGQPFLVNRLAQMLTAETEIDVSQPITGKHLEKALIHLVNENNTHFSSIYSQAALHRTEVIKTLFSARRYYNFQDEVAQDLLMYGVLRTVTDEQGMKYARIANPIYQKMLIKAFGPSTYDTENEVISQWIE